MTNASGSSGHHGHGHAAHKVMSNATASSAGTASDIGYPHGHLGHLTAYEAEALAKFKVYCQEKGDYKPVPPPSHDDQTLLRFLRARKWAIEDAYKQFKETEDWRAELDLDTLYETIDVEAYERSRKLYPQWTGRRDKRGIPVYLFEIHHLDSKTVHEYEKSLQQPYSRASREGSVPHTARRLAGLYENLTRFVQPLCTQLPDHPHAGVTPITLSTNIVDVSGVSLRQFWNLKAHMQAASTVATAHYPETLDRIFIIGAPMFFSTVWGWIKRWFDPVTVSKIFILGQHEVKPTLEAFIEPRNIPKAFGGELDFSWGDLPNLDPVLVKTATWENGKVEIPHGPLYWHPVDDGARQELVAVGSANGQPRRLRIATLPTIFPPVAKKADLEAEKQPVVTTGVQVEAAPAVSTKDTAEVQSMESLSLEDKANGAAEVSEKVPEVLSTEAATATA